LTVKEQLREALTTIRRKRRSALRLNEKAYKKAVGIAHFTSRSKRKKSAAKAAQSSEPEAGRDAGKLGTGSESVT
jgi:hypothetical protein